MIRVGGLSFPILPMSLPPKYIFVNGVMKLNPAYSAETNQPSTVAQPSQALAIVSSTDDIMAGSSNPNYNLQLSESTTSSMEIIQDPSYTKSFGSNVDGGQLLDEFTKMFAEYEIPIGLINKVLALIEANLYFIIDDSGSMALNSDVQVKDATQWLKSAIGNKKQLTDFLSRYEECRDRLHLIVKLLAYVSINSLNFSFLNNSQEFVLKRTEGQSPKDFEDKCHQTIETMFQTFRAGSTPIYAPLKKVLDLDPTKRKMVYLLTDGLPNESVSSICDLVRNRKNPQNSPLTLLSCSNVDSDTEWLKELEEKAPFTAELDDFISERREVEHDQGPTFPYSRGFWLLSMLVAAINPDDLDALDESIPFTLGTMNNLLGRKLTPPEYAEYWNKNPNSSKYQHLYSQFQREDLVSSQIVKK